MDKMSGRTPGLVDEILIIKFFPIDGLASAISAWEVTTLAHKTQNNTVIWNPYNLYSWYSEHKFSAIFGTSTSNSSKETRLKGSTLNILGKNKVRGASGVVVPPGLGSSINKTQNR